MANGGTKGTTFKDFVQQTQEGRLKAKMPKTDPSPYYKPWISHQYSKGSYRLNNYFGGSYFVFNFSITFMSLNSSDDSTILQTKTNRTQKSL